MGLLLGAATIGAPITGLSLGAATVGTLMFAATQGGLFGEAGKYLDKKAAAKNTAIFDKLFKASKSGKLLLGQSYKEHNETAENLKKLFLDLKNQR